MKHAVSAGGILFACCIMSLAYAYGELWTSGQVLFGLFCIAGGLTPAACYLLGEKE